MTLVEIALLEEVVRDLKDSIEGLRGEIKDLKKDLSAIKAKGKAKTKRSKR